MDSWLPNSNKKTAFASLAAFATSDKTKATHKNAKIDPPHDSKWAT
jgi:hypothetical protein